MAYGTDDQLARGLPSFCCRFRFNRLYADVVSDFHLASARPVEPAALHIQSLASGGSRCSRGHYPSHSREVKKRTDHECDAYN